ncbi:MarR family winged helix-turn-helix transcriptional regulator, partial [Acidisphaera rubrifaciens]|uniref:MarR family winged helix-turn-helix transcriptional regulator n=1 Tax=Acidisphaera rubrifaciens TaxID=50715 RepID=UPI0009FFC836
MAEGSINDALRLENQLCFALYAATHAMTRAYRTRLSAIGLTYPQYLVLLALMERPLLSVTSLARLLQLDAATLTPLLKRLETAGLVARRRSATDERVVEISLTAAGRTLRRDLGRIQQEVTCDSGLSPAAFAALRGTLHDLADTFTGGPEGEGDPAAEPGAAEPGAAEPAAVEPAAPEAADA